MNVAFPCRRSERGGIGARHPLRLPGYRRQVHQNERPGQLLQNRFQGTKTKSVSHTLGFKLPTGGSKVPAALYNCIDKCSLYWTCLLWAIVHIRMFRHRLEYFYIRYVNIYIHDLILSVLYCFTLPAK